MPKFLLALVGPALILLGTSASAELARIDLDTEGDALILRDTETSLDWLVLTETAGLSYADLEAGAGGWLERGFRLATGAEVCSLFSRHAIAPSPCPDPGLEVGNPGQVLALIDALEATFTAPDGSLFVASYRDGDDELLGQGSLMEVPAHSYATVADDKQTKQLSSFYNAHFLVRPFVTIYGEEFGSFDTSVPLAPNLPVRTETIPGWSVDPGLSLYLPDMTDDGTIFIANVTQSYNQNLPLNCTTVVTCFNPMAPVCGGDEAPTGGHFSTLRIPDQNGQQWAPPEAETNGCAGANQGADTSDIVVTGSGPNERVLFDSFRGSRSAAVPDDTRFPAWGQIAKTGGLWQVDTSSLRFSTTAGVTVGNPVGLVDSNPGESDLMCKAEDLLLCADDSDCPQGASCIVDDPVTGRMGCAISCASGCPNGTTCGGDLLCRALDCGGINELAVLPQSGHVVATLYNRPGIAVSEPGGKILAYFEFPQRDPSAVHFANPCLPNTLEPEIFPASREVEVDPTSDAGDERFAIGYDTWLFEKGYAIQEFRYVDELHGGPRIEEVTAPFSPWPPSLDMPTCELTSVRKSVVNYDTSGNLWVHLAIGFGRGPTIAYLADPATGERALETTCGPLKPDGTLEEIGIPCLGDLDVGPIAGVTGTKFGVVLGTQIFHEPSSDALFAATIFGSIHPIRDFEGTGREVYYSGDGVSLRPTTISTQTWMWKAALHPSLPEFWLPIGRAPAGAGVGAPGKGWLYRVPVEGILGADAELLGSIAPARTSAGQVIQIVLATDLPDELAAGNSGLFVITPGAAATSSAIVPWTTDCDPAPCVVTASLPASLTATPDLLRWHAFIHSSEGRVHVAGLVDVIDACVGADADGDGVCDVADNCTAAANPAQIDSDSDGYGNRCDADFDNDGFVGEIVGGQIVPNSDLAYMQEIFESKLGDGRYDSEVDLDSDGLIHFDDLAILLTSGESPGPSGLAP